MRREGHTLGPPESPRSAADMYLSALVIYHLLNMFHLILLTILSRRNSGPSAAEPEVSTFSLSLSFNCSDFF